ncbi:MAG TPA: phosphodiester glycosidase family protein [Pyrinomonadaceae bacterium]|nr:phosphodiester glycosidase family protein [Pyrinomonadaceae bacterium]
MKNKFSVHEQTQHRFCTIFFFLFVLCFYAVDLTAQDWKTVADGVEHAQVRREFTGKFVDINLLRLDLKKVRLDVRHAMDAAIGTERTSSIATRHGAFAAINAGFFRLDTSIWAGDSVGILKSNGESLSESSRDRVALFIMDRPTVTSVEIAHVTNSLTFRIGRTVQSIMGLNRERLSNETVLLTPDFHQTTLTSCDGISIVVRRNRISAVHENKCGIKIPADGFVISALGDQHKLIKKMVLKIGVRVMVSDRVVSFTNDPSPREKRRVRDLTLLYQRASGVTNGVPQLINKSKIDITWEQEKASKSFVETRHPRTAVAKLKDGKFLMLTADGRSDASAGLDLYDLAKYMLELGAVDAMNLDGGGSTTMFLDGKVVNKPSDKEGERKIGDAILVTLRKPVRK